jgi:hypothetical protein
MTTNRRPVEKALHREQILPWEVPEVISNLYRNIRELPLGLRTMVTNSAGI